MKLIAIDSSGLVATVAILENEELIAEYTIQYKKTHSQTLLPMLNEIRQMTQLDMSTVDAIAVSAGPGSFTGLRIGSATAKGIGLALDIPIVSVPTIEGLAYNLYGTDKYVCPIMDARRSQVYTGLYEYVRTDDGFEMNTVMDSCALAFEELAAKLNEYGREVIFLGDGVPVFKEVIPELVKVPYSFAPACCGRQHAACVGVLGMKYFLQGKYDSAENHAPEYLRLSQAERERKEKEVLVRYLEESDVDAVCILEEKTFSMPWHKADFLDMIRDEKARYYVAEEEGRIIAGAGILWVAGEGNITNFAVDEAYRRKGIGTRLLKYMIDDAKDNQINAITLEVRVSNSPAIALYEKNGFKSEGIRPGFYEKPVEDAQIMWRRQ